jgi:phenol hydroxylase P1 protein
MLSRVGMVVGGGSDDVLVTAKDAWLRAPVLQGLRRLEEELLVGDDWATKLIALHLADLLVYGLMFQFLDEDALLGGAGAYSLLAQHLAAWFADQRRWVDALIRAWLSDPEHTQTNRAALQEVVDARWAQVVQAASDLAGGVAAHIPVRATEAVTTLAATVAGELAALGLRTCEVTR